MAHMLKSLADLSEFHKVGLIVDGWENVNGEPIVNFLAVVGDKIFFLGSAYCGTTQQMVLCETRTRVPYRV
jgi:hypothetical protein